MDFLEKINKRSRQFFALVASFLLNFFSKKGFSKSKKIEIVAPHDLEKKLVLSLSKSRIPNLRQLKYIKKYLTPGEVLVIRASVVVIVFSTIFLATRFYLNHLKVVPVRGGTYIEGVVGVPKLINPLYSSVNDVDSDIASLVFSSLFKRDKYGKLNQDIVKEYSIEDSGKKYVFQIRDDIQWHDGKKLTVDDIVFTFNLIKEKKFNSPLRSGFVGVNIEKDKESEGKFSFNLSEPYAAFAELLTFGILQKDIWSQATPDSILLDLKNLKPIGSGPFKFKDFVKGEKGGIRQYNLEINDSYYGAKPLVKISYKFFVSYEELISALNSGDIEGVSYLPKQYKQEIIVPKTYSFNKLYLPQATLLFFNDKNNAALADRSIKKALAYALDKNYIVNQVLNGDAYVVDGPILPGNFAYYSDLKKYEYNVAEAKKLLDSVDWKSSSITEANIEEAKVNAASTEDAVKKKAESTLRVGQGEWRMKDGNFLIVKITTTDHDDNTATVEAVRGFWEAIGVKTEISIVNAPDIRSEVIQDKNFEILFYGQSLSIDPDPYAFWHSSQISADGLNLASYNNKEVDQLLEEGRAVSDMAKRQEKYKRFQEIIADELPAIFVYSPSYIYTQNHKLKGFEVSNISIPADRFSNINEWYLETGKKINW